jgi:nitric oxide reductase NorD protein
MEEHVGALWHRLITRLAQTRHPDAAVRLAEVASTVGIVFRALGGDGGLQVEAADATTLRTRRGWLQRIAGTGSDVELAWRDERSLRLPAVVDWFADRALNRDLYLWLAALAVHDEGGPGDWLAQSQALVRRALAHFPGLRPRWERLVAAHLAQRPAPERLPAAEAARERAIRAALRDPGSVAALPAARGDAFPVPLWLHPAPPRPPAAAPRAHEDDGQGDRAGATRRLDDARRRRAERVEDPQGDRGLVTIRMENIFTVGELVNVDRGAEDEDDLERAAAAAKDMDRITVSRSRKASAARLKFDLDLPAEAHDDLVLDEGVLLPEWDWKKARLQPDHCRIVSLLAADAPPCALPPHLRRTARRLRSQFQALAPARTWFRGLADGPEIDLDAYLRFAADRTAGHGVAADGLYRALRAGSRDLACLLLADLSLSTDTWVDDHHRVIDVIRDSLFLFGESLAATGDRFAVLGFSSRRRDPVRVHTLKSFGEPYGAAVRGRIAAIRPGYYTRMGAAVRHGTELLRAQPSNRRLLLLLTDGKPNDIDKYEGRYGVEDTRHAVLAARRLGLQPFCVTIDDRGNDYLPHLFGSDGYVVIRRPAELPARLPALYARLTRTTA